MGGNDPNIESTHTHYVQVQGVTAPAHLVQALTKLSPHLARAKVRYTLVCTHTGVGAGAGAGL